MPGLIIKTIPVSPFQQNARILEDLDTETILFIDPGDDIPKLITSANLKNKPIAGVFLTHSHLDHAGGVQDLYNWFETNNRPKPPLYAHRAENEMRKNMGYQSLMFGMGDHYKNITEPIHYVEDGDTLQIGNVSGKLLFTPGHSPGHLALYVETITLGMVNSEKPLIGNLPIEAPLLIGGDALFAGSIGRTDLPGGNHDELITSIKTKLFTLPNATLVLSGHGPNTSIGEEKKSNPFVGI